jgi:RimJ/RimL family protein N-acetyltransferase
MDPLRPDRTPVKAPQRLQTQRLVMERPRPADASEIFRSYASDPEVTRYLGWPTHRSVVDTRAFLELSDAEWQRWSVGPYLVRAGAGGELLGCTGLHLETPLRAATGYVFARGAWGKGFATETVQAIVGVAGTLGLRRVHAFMHPEHLASQRVLDKCGFTREAVLHRYLVFPNLGSAPQDVSCHALLL